MTLIVAIACSNGVVLAADSASTDADSGLKQHSTKIKKLANQPVLYGGSGDVGLLQKIDEGLEGFPTDRTTLNSIRKEIKRRVVPELQESAHMHVSYPQQGFNMPPVAILLFVGIAAGKPFILEIERNAGDTLYNTPDFGNFGAIGSGKPLAQATFRPHLYTERDLELGKTFAYRVVEDAIDLSSSGLAHPIHIHTIDGTGVIMVVESDEMRSLRDSCAAWREVERDALGVHLAPNKAMADSFEVPRPSEQTAEEAS